MTDPSLQQQGRMEWRLPQGQRPQTGPSPSQAAAPWGPWDAPGGGGKCCGRGPPCLGPFVPRGLKEQTWGKPTGKAGQTAGDGVSDFHRGFARQWDSEKTAAPRSCFPCTPPRGPVCGTGGLGVAVPPRPMGGPTRRTWSCRLPGLGWASEPPRPWPGISARPRGVGYSRTAQAVAPASPGTSGPWGSGRDPGRSKGQGHPEPHRLRPGLVPRPFLPAAQCGLHGRGTPFYL